MLGFQKASDCILNLIRLALDEELEVSMIEQVADSDQVLVGLHYLWDRNMQSFQQRRAGAFGIMAA